MVWRKAKQQSGVWDKYGRSTLISAVPVHLHIKGNTYQHSTERPSDNVEWMRNSHMRVNTSHQTFRLIPCRMVAEPYFKRARACLADWRRDGFDYVIVGVERKLRHDDERAGATTGPSAAAARLRPATLSRTTERRRQTTSRTVPPCQVPRRTRTRNAFPAGKEDSLLSGTQYWKRINHPNDIVEESDCQGSTDWIVA